MLTRVERVVISVADLPQAVETYSRLGFELHSSAESALAFNAENCLELVPTPERLAQGLQYVVVESDDLARDVAGMRGRGIDISEAAPRRDAADTVWAELGLGNPLPLQFVQHHLPAVRRRPHVCAHPNQVERLDGANIAMTNALALVETYARVLGHRPGAAVRSGPSGRSLEGPGPFQVLYRTRSVGAGAAWMAAHGIAPHPRVVRNDGQQAVLEP